MSARWLELAFQRTFAPAHHQCCRDWLVQKGLGVVVQAKNLDALAAFVRDRRLDYVQPGMLSRLSKSDHVTCKAVRESNLPFCSIFKGTLFGLQFWMLACIIIGYLDIHWTQVKKHNLVRGDA